MENMNTKHYIVRINLNYKYVKKDSNDNMYVVVDGKERKVINTQVEISDISSYDDESVINIYNRILSRLDGTTGIHSVRLIG